MCRSYTYKNVVRLPDELYEGSRRYSIVVFQYVDECLASFFLAHAQAGSIR